MGSTPYISDESPFTLNNIPFGVISTEQDPAPRCASAIGDEAIDLRALSKTGFFADSSVVDALGQTTLNSFAALPATTRTAVREQIIAGCKDGKIPSECLHKLTGVKTHLPVYVPGYTDFYCSLEHCQNVSHHPKHCDFFFR